MSPGFDLLGVEVDCVPHCMTMSIQQMWMFYKLASLPSSSGMIGLCGIWPWVWVRRFEG